MTGGAAITVITKSGTNEFRGSAVRDARQQQAARVHSGTRTAPASPRSRTGNRNIDGGSLGGPIRRNKLFFFADWEGTFERVNRSRLLLRADGGLPARRFQPHARRADPRRQRRRHHGADDRRRLDGAARRHDLRSVLRQSGWHRPLGLLQRRTLNVIPQGRLNGPMMQTAGPRAAAESVRRQRQLLQLRHAAARIATTSTPRSTGTATSGISCGSSTA